jgi:hypothetical protein
MDDQAFDKLLADKLNNLDDYPVREDGWQAVRQRLNQGQSSRKAYWLLALLLLCLAGLSGWLGYQWHRTLQQYDALRSTIDKTQPVSSTQVSDTVIQRIVVHHYDTVYRTVVYREESPSATQEAQQSQLGAKLRATNDNSLSNSLLTTDDTLSDSPSGGMSIFADSTRTGHVNNSLFDSTLSSQSPDSLLAVATPLEVDSAAVVPRENEGAVWEPRFRLGLGAQGLSPMRPGISQALGGGGGVSGSWLVTRKLGLVARIHYLRTEYTLATAEESLGVADVLSGSVYQNDELLEVQNRQSQWQWGGGAQYRFASGKQWTPLVSLHYLVESPLRRTLTYSLSDAITDKVYVEELSGALPTYRHIVDVELGIERPLTHRTVWQLAGFYNTQLTEQPPVRLNQIGLRTRIYYEFK